MPPFPPATSARASRAVTETPLDQKNHQKWCLSPGSEDMCNLSPSGIACASTLVPQLLPLLHVHHAPPLATYQTLMSPNPKRSQPSRLPRASRVIHALGRSYHAPSCAKSAFHARLRALASFGAWVACASLRRLTIIWRVRYMRPTPSSSLAHVVHALDILSILQLPRVPQSARHVNPSLYHVSSSKKRDPDSQISTGSNGLEPGLLKWVRPSISPWVFRLLGPFKPAHSSTRPSGS